MLIKNMYIYHLWGLPVTYISDWLQVMIPLYPIASIKNAVERNLIMLFNIFAVFVAKTHYQPWVKNKK